MKMQALASVVLVSLAMPLSLAAPPPPEKAIGINLALRDLAPGVEQRIYFNSNGNVNTGEIDWMKDWLTKRLAWID